MSWKIILLSRFLVVNFIISLPSVLYATERQTRIIGGYVSQPGDWPWMAYLHEITGNEFCGASLIHPFWVMTAAHCLDNEANTAILRPDQIYVSIESNNQHYAVKNIIQPENWRRANTYSFPDIGLIELKEPVSDVEPVSLLLHADPILTTTGTLAIALGRGLTNLSNPYSYPDNLHQVNLPLVDQNVCEEAYRDEDPILDTMLCAGYPLGGKDTCIGDSGGPLVVWSIERQNWIQIGITSFGGRYNGPLCAGVNAYGVYTRISAFNDFILATIPEYNIAQYSPYSGVWMVEEYVNTFVSFHVMNTDHFVAVMMGENGNKWFALTGIATAETTLTSILPASLKLNASLRAISMDNAELQILSCRDEASGVCPLPKDALLRLKKMF